MLSCHGPAILFYMTNTIRTGLSGVSAIRLSGGGGGRTGGALSSLASQVAGRFADALNLASGDQSEKRGRNFIAANDLYEIEQMADELAKELAGSAADKARLAAALHKFAEHSAALMGARPAAYSVQHLSNAIESALTGGDATNITSALAVIERASANVAAARK